MTVTQVTATNFLLNLYFALPVFVLSTPMIMQDQFYFSLFIYEMFQDKEGKFVS